MDVVWHDHTLIYNNIRKMLRHVPDSLPNHFTKII